MTPTWDEIVELHEIIDLPILTEDFYTPDSSTHMVMVLNTDPGLSQEYVPIMVTGSQWDFLWWVYRLEYQEIMHLFSFNEFVMDFMGERYNEYVRKKMGK